MFLLSALGSVLILCGKMIIGVGLAFWTHKKFQKKED